LDIPDIHEAISRIRQLPTLPSVLAQILATVAEPDASALDLGRHIAADQSLSAILLRLVNSAYYGFYRQINSVTKAIVILGFVEVRNLVVATTAFRALSGGYSQYDRVQLWRHALATAMASERCATMLDTGIEEAFVCGLLHDIGKVTLDMLYPEEFRAAADRAHSEGKFIRETERETFGMDHAEVGGLLGEHWNLPASVVDAIQYHHAPEESAQNPRQADLTAVANFIAYEAGIGESGNGCEPLVPEAAISRLGASETQWRDICEDLRQVHGRIDEILGTLAR